MVYWYVTSIMPVQYGIPCSDSHETQMIRVTNIACTIFSPNRMKKCTKHVPNVSYALKVWISKHRFSRNSQNAQQQYVQVHTELNQLDRSVTVTELIFMKLKLA
jgi:hypothetical protein